MIEADPALSFEQFVEACERTRSANQTRALLFDAAERAGFRGLVLATHGPLEQLGAMGVRAHNLPARAEAAFFAQDAAPLLGLAGAAARLFSWRAEAMSAKAAPEHRPWWAGLARAGFETGITQPIRSALTPASCTLFGCGEAGELDRARWLMRAATLAFHHLLTLQRPALNADEMLTGRERQCLALAALAGMRPREVAASLGVSLNTVRTLRQRALLRLGARSAEEAVWRMLASGQLFAADASTQANPKRRKKSR